MKTQENPQHFFEEFIGEKSTEFFMLPQSGSARANYVGKTSKSSYIVTFNDYVRENESFFYFSEVFAGSDLNTPKILKISKDRTLYIQEFLGKNTLSEIIEKEGESDHVKLLVKETLQKLFELQTKTQGKIDYSRTFEYEKYDELPILNDLFYFKKLFVDILEIQYHKSSLLKEFKKLVRKIELLEPKTLMIRDFQSRNILVNDDSVFFIDYQSAMEGPAMYDVVSFLFQAKANFSEIFKQEMLRFYISLWDDEDKKRQLNVSVKPIQLMRFMQVLGAYGFRGLIQQKKHFVDSIEKGIENIYAFSKNWEEMNEFPELKKLLETLKKEETKQKIQNIIFNINN